MALTKRPVHSIEPVTGMVPANALRPFFFARRTLAIVVPIIAYVSLRPFQGWRDPGRHPLAYLFSAPPFVAPFDALLNVMGYLLLSLCLTLALFPRIRGRWAFAIGFLGPMFCSVTVEAIQTYLPGRHPSVIDVITNTTGAMLGAAIAVFSTPWLADHRGKHFRERWFVPGHVTEIGLLVLLGWFVALFAQRTILFGTGDFRGNFGATLDLGLPPIVYTVTEVYVVAANLVVAGLVLRLVASDGVARVHWLLVLVAAAIATRVIAQLTFWKIGAAFAWITPEVLIGVISGTAVALLTLGLSRRAAAMTALALLATSLAVVNITPPDPALWLQASSPRERMLIGLVLVARYMAKGWPFAAIVFLVMAAMPFATRRPTPQEAAHSP